MLSLTGYLSEQQNSLATLTLHFKIARSQLKASYNYKIKKHEQTTFALPYCSHAIIVKHTHHKTCHAI